MNAVDILQQVDSSPTTSSIILSEPVISIPPKKIERGSLNYKRFLDKVLFLVIENEKIGSSLLLTHVR